MERPSKKVLMPLFLISIIVPVGLFLGFSRPSEPSISREVTANTIEWNFTRPNYSYPTSEYFYIAKSVANSYTDDFGTIKFSLFIDSYYEENPRDGDIMNFYILFRVILLAVSFTACK